MIGIKVMESKGEVVGTLVVDPHDEVIAVTGSGVVIRIPVDDISVQGRNAAGVRVMSPDAGDRVVAIALVTDEDHSDPEADSDSGEPRP